MDCNSSVMWAQAGYGWLALVLGTWAAYEAYVRISNLMRERRKPRGRHR